MHVNGTLFSFLCLLVFKNVYENKVLNEKKIECVGINECITEKGINLVTEIKTNGLLYKSLFSCIQNVMMDAEVVVFVIVGST